MKAAIERGGPAPPLILASTSSYRRALLERLGLPFVCLAPLIDEESLKGDFSDPRLLAEHLARAKARSVSAERPDAVVIGSDQVVVLDRQILGKPGTHERAVEQLSALSGRQHEIITSVNVMRDARSMAHADVSRLHVRRLDREAIERYVALDNPLDCAGGYKLESRGIALFERVESADHTAITGLPLIALASMLREFGFVIP